MPIMFRKNLILNADTFAGAQKHMLLDMISRVKSMEKIEEAIAVIKKLRSRAETKAKCSRDGIIQVRVYDNVLEVLRQVKEKHSSDQNE